MIKTTQWGFRCQRAALERKEHGPVRGGRRRGCEAGGGAADADAEPGTAPPSLDAADARKIESLGPSLSASGGKGDLR